MKLLDRVIKRLRMGDAAYMMFNEHGYKVWWFECPRLDFDDGTMERARQQVPVKERGDSLFGLPDNSQTWKGST